MVRSAVVPAAEPEAKRSASAAALLDATAALLSERGGLDVALAEIAKRSGLNSALIKYYFGNKEGLLLALLERDADRHMSALQDLVVMALSADQKLKIHIGASSRPITAHPISTG
jgi:AcrR family transcriptional regulator